MESSKEQIEAQLCAYIDGELDDAQRADIERHIATNPQHKALIEQLRGQSGLLRQLPRAKAPLELNEALCGQLERSALLNANEDEESHTLLSINRWPQITAVAAVLLLAIGLGVVVYYVLPPSGTNPNPSLAVDHSKLNKQGDGAIPDKTKNPIKLRDTDEYSVRKLSPSDQKAAEEKAIKEQEASLLSTLDAKAKDKALVSAREVDELRKRASIGFGDSLATNAGNTSLYFVVSTSDAAAANTQVTSYFKSNHIPYLNYEDDGKPIAGLGAVATATSPARDFREEVLRFKEAGNERTPQIPGQVQGPANETLRQESAVTRGGGFAGGGSGGRGGGGGAGGGGAGALEGRSVTNGVSGGAGVRDGNNADLPPGLSKAEDHLLDKDKQSPTTERAAKGSGYGATREFKRENEASSPAPAPNRVAAANSAAVTETEKVPTKPGELAKPGDLSLKNYREHGEVTPAKQEEQTSRRGAAIDDPRNKDLEATGRPDLLQKSVPSEKTAKSDVSQAKPSYQVEPHFGLAEKSAGQTYARGGIIRARMNRRQASELSASLSRELGERTELAVINPVDGTAVTKNFTLSDSAVAGKKIADAPVTTYDASGTLNAPAPVTGPAKETTALANGIDPVSSPAATKPRAAVQYAEQPVESNTGARRGAGAVVAAKDTYRYVATQPGAAGEPENRITLKTDPMDEPVDVFIFVKPVEAAGAALQPGEAKSGVDASGPSDSKKK